MFAAAVDAIIVMSSEGLVDDWNPAAERLFGYGRAEVLGRELAQLIIPVALRSQHRMGVKRFRETGEAPLLGRRLELFGVSRAGELIPVELTITQIPGADPPQFAGTLRDLRAERDEAVPTPLP